MKVRCRLIVHLVQCLAYENKDPNLAQNKAKHTKTKRQKQQQQQQKAESTQIGVKIIVAMHTW